MDHLIFLSSNVKFIGKHKQSSDTLDRDSRKPNLFFAYCKKRGHTKDTCCHLEKKSTHTPPQMSALIVALQMSAQNVVKPRT